MSESRCVAVAYLNDNGRQTFAPDPTCFSSEEVPCDLPALPLEYLYHDPDDAPAWVTWCRHHARHYLRARTVSRVRRRMAKERAETDVNMSVKELIQYLETLPLDHPVWIMDGNTGYRHPLRKDCIHVERLGFESKSLRVTIEVDS